VSMNVGVSLPPAPPMPMLDVDFDFTNGRAESRGLEIIAGPGPTDNDRLVTLFLRKLKLSPAYFLLMPGGQLDCGVILGKPSQRDDDEDPYFEFIIGGATMVTFGPVLGVLL